MKRRRILGLVLAAVLVLPPALGAQTPLERVRQMAAAIERLTADGEPMTEERLRGARRRLEHLRGQCGDSAPCLTLVAFSLGYLYERGAEARAEQHDAFLKRAAKSYAEALRYRPENAQIRTNLALVYRRLKSLDKALEVLGKVRPRKGRDATAHYLLLGDLHHEAGATGRALASWARAAKIEPANADVHRRVFRALRRDPDPPVLYKYCEKLWQDDLDRLAVEGLEIVIRDARQDDPRLAEEALLHWAELRAQTRGLSLQALERLPAGWKSSAYRGLRMLLGAEKPLEAGIDWWAEDDLRRHVAVKILQARSARLAERGRLVEAAAVLEPVFAFAPRADVPGRRAAARLDAAIQLATLYHRLDDEKKLERLSRDLFDRKSLTAPSRDFAAARRYHTVLGLVYHERGDIDRVTYQLEQALKANRARGQQESRPEEPSPRLRTLLAEAYEKSGRNEDAARTYFAAALDYLDLDDLKKADETTSRIRQLGSTDLPVGDVEQVIASREAVVAGRLDATQVLLGAGWLSDPKTLEIDADFVERQRFKGLADLTAAADRAGETADAQFVGDLALRAVRGQQELPSRGDQKRLECLEQPHLQLDQKLVLDESVRRLKKDGRVDG